MNFSLRVKANPRLRDLGALLTLDKNVMEEVVQAVDADFRKHESRLFATEGGAAGSPWQKLSPEYRKRKNRLFSAVDTELKRQAKTRGRVLRGAALAKARGSTNKILQLTGDMRRAFAETGGGTTLGGVRYEHIARAYRAQDGRWRLAFGAHGPAFYGYHAAGAGRLPRRNPLAHSDEQWRRYLARTRRVMIPHILRRVRVLAAAGRALRAA